MSTKPNAAQLEQNTGLSPTARNWIKTLINEAIDRGIADAITSRPQQRSGPVENTENYGLLKDRVDDIVKRLDYIEHVYDEDQRYSLTKAKVIALLKKEGIE